MSTTVSEQDSINPEFEGTEDDIEAYIGDFDPDDNLLSILGIDPETFEIEDDVVVDEGGGIVTLSGTDYVDDDFDPDSVGLSYFLAPAIGPGPYDKGKGLFGEVNTRWPNRDHSSDGWIGDPSHAARVSDHNPDWAANGRYEGIVRAVDIDTNGGSGELTDIAKAILESAIGDERVWYVIFNRKIYSRTYGWAARSYSGHPHDKHIHVSLRHEHREFDTSQWLDDKEKKQKRKYRKTRSQKIDYSILRNVFKGYLEDPDGDHGKRKHVARLQDALNRRGAHPKLKVDGRMGRKTFRAWRRYEMQTGRNGRPGMVDAQSLTRLLAPRYEFTD